MYAIGYCEEVVRFSRVVEEIIPVYSGLDRWEYVDQSSCHDPQRGWMQVCFCVVKMS